MSGTHRIIRTPENSPAYFDAAQPPFPAEPGWFWFWRRPREGKWCGRRVFSRRPRNKLGKRLINRSLDYPVFCRLLDLMFPWRKPWDYPGINGATREAIGVGVDEISAVTLWGWRSGRYVPPQWACDALASFAEDRGRALIEAAAALRVMPRGPGRGQGRVKAPPVLRAERLAREEAERHAMLNPGPIPRPNVPEPPPSTGCRAWIEAQLGRQLD